MAAGDYDYRARLVSGDELGQLTEDFNRMANALEDTIIKLEEEIRAREDFVGAFAHELKTPLTSYVARHSWATTALQKGVPVSVISAGMGHASEKVTYIYLASFDNKTLSNANKKVIAAVRLKKEEEE